MIKGGYILQPRKFDKSEAANLPPVTRELWFYLLRNVNHKDNGKFKRGQGFFNLSDIQEDLCWYVGYRKETYSKPQLTKSLRRLCEGNMIETAKATRGLFVTVCNYEHYQDPSNYEGNNEGNTKETRRKQWGHTKNKNVEECKNEEEKPKPRNTFELPEWVPKESWEAYDEMRRKKDSKAWTDRAKQLAIGKLEKFRKEGYDPGDILDQSTMNGWKGLFPLKDKESKEDRWDRIFRKVGVE